MILCKSCRLCADGVGGNRKCYLDIDYPLRMTSIPLEERQNCRYYEKSDEPSWRRYEIRKCPNCGKGCAVVFTQNGNLRDMCEYCGYDRIH